MFLFFSLMLNVIFIAFILQIYSVFCFFPNFLEFFFLLCSRLFVSLSNNLCNQVISEK